ncbi:hypothetical protein [Bifidobacterium callitrichidarum]|uniref:Uncharacterized protein n=1 Tax=Bifidobacterium callitrichidarum TaxID=2052941 RepID=A0A2U2N8T8_9BIFI|nr:hypothetical protein [Bifidobacterium callitrichidarum]PWG65601.1 hypothetical protein DF196_06620 [Bifidobacterium callitrichidarum]
MNSVLASMTKEEQARYFRENGIPTIVDMSRMARRARAERRLDTMPSLASIRRSVDESHQRMD